MPKPPAAEQYHTRKTNSQTAKTTPLVEKIEASSMANVADMLTELNSLCSEFSLKLDGINNQLGELTNSISVM